MKNTGPQRAKLDTLKPNPKNPRVIKDDKFQKLVQSIRAFPQMLEVRPIVCTPDGVVLGGNMRLRACKEAGLREVPVHVVSWLDSQQEEFIIKDNVGFGEWDWDVLANEWDATQLEDWGLDVWIAPEEPTAEDLIGEEKDKPPTLKITFASPEQLQKAEIEIQEFLDRECPGAYFSISVGAA